MEKNDIYNVPIRDQIKKAILEHIADESQMVNHAISEIKQKVQKICLSDLSKETKKKKIREIVSYINKYSDPWIDSCKHVDKEVFIK